jgi:hypothetical protein
MSKSHQKIAQLMDANTSQCKGPNTIQTELAIGGIATPRYVLIVLLLLPLQ